MLKRRYVFVTPVLLALALAAACGRDEARTREPEPAPTASSLPATAAEPDARPRLVFLGDSLTAGLGLSPDQAFPALIQQKVDADGLDYQVVNAGVSGDTSAGGLSRLDWALEGDVRAMVVALGGIDVLRGLPAG